MKMVYFFVGIFIFSDLNAVSFFSEQKAKNAYLKKDYKKAKEILEKEQIDDPTNPELNYNLGNVYYKLQSFDNAKRSFKRAIDNCLDTQKDLQKRSFFNLGNTYYKSCLSFLGSNWEKKYLSKELLDKSIVEIKSSIDSYQKVIYLNSKDEKSLFNKKQAEELLKKLEEKKEQEQNKDNQQNQNDSDKLEKSQKTNQDDNNQNNNKNEQSNNDKQNQDKSSDNNEKNYGQDNSGQQNNKNSNGYQQESKSENESDNSERGRDQREDEMLNKNKSSEEQQKVDKDNKHSKSSPKNKNKINNDKENNMQQEHENQEFDKAKQVNALNKPYKGNISNDFKEKGMRVLLDKLQSEESKLQKMLIMQKSKSFKPISNDKQKPW